MSFLEFFVTTVIGGFYLYMMAYAANMAPIPTAKIFARWNGPIWERRLGSNKTWFGTSGGLAAAVLVAFGEDRLNERFSIPEYLHLERIYVIPWPLLGLMMGFGALIVGDMAKSAIKRRYDIKPGAPWKPWDDLDFGIGTTVMLVPFLWRSPLTILSGVLIGFFFNPIINKLSHRVGMKKVPY